MAPAGDIRGSVRAFTVADGQVYDLEIELCGAKEQVKIPKRIEIAKVFTVGGDQVVILFPEDFRAAERILERLSQQPGKCQAEEFVPQEIQVAHGLVLHGID